MGNFVWFKLIVKGVSWGGGRVAGAGAAQLPWAQAVSWGWGALPPGGGKVRFSTDRGGLSGAGNLVKLEFAEPSHLFCSPPAICSLTSTLYAKCSWAWG